MAGSKSFACECADPGCPVHKGVSKCSHVGRCKTLYRVDMEDQTGTKMCSACAEDAFDSGLFTEEK